MVRDCYVGVNNIARKLVNGYVFTRNTSAKNLLQNGSLYNGYDGWLVDVNYVTVTQNDGYVTCSHTKTSDDSSNPFVIRQFFNPSKLSINENTNVIWYACAKIRGRTTNQGFANFYLGNGGEKYSRTLYNLDSGSVNDGEWHTSSAYYKYKERANDNWIPDMLKLYINGYNEQYDIKEISVFNISEIFGLGNEPTKEWCDENLTNYSDIIQLPQGVSGISPKKIVSGYVGVNGLAKKLFGLKDTSFNSNIIPSNWVIKSYTNDTAESSNSYGRWVINGQVDRSTPVSNSVDADDNTYCEFDRNQTFVLSQYMLYLPTGVSIDVSKLQIVVGYGSNVSVWGYNDSVGWERLCNLGSATSSKQVHDHDVSTHNFYTKFRVQACPRSSGNFRLYSFKILSGIIRA